MCFPQSQWWKVFRATDDKVFPLSLGVRDRIECRCRVHTFYNPIMIFLPPRFSTARRGSMQQGDCVFLSGPRVRKRSAGSSDFNSPRTPTAQPPKARRDCSFQRFLMARFLVYSKHAAEARGRTFSASDVRERMFEFCGKNHFVCPTRPPPPTPPPTPPPAAQNRLREPPAAFFNE